MRAVEVRLQNASMQAGIEKNPVIQWQYGEEDAGKRQSSYQIQILNEKGEICADTGEINSSEQNNIEIPMELKSLCILRSPAVANAFWNGRFAEHNGRPLLVD